MVKAIVYTTNTGHTAEYAALLGKETGLPVFPLSQAAIQLKKNTPIIYLGWIMANRIKGYRKACKKFHVRAVCSVGMLENGGRAHEIREANHIPENTQLFTLQGGFDIRKLSGPYKWIMKPMVKVLIRDLSNQSKKTQKEIETIRILQNGGSSVHRENLSEVLSWYQMLSN